MAGKARGRQSIFITGAASGMGRETAKLFANKGWFVGAYDVNTDGLKTLEQELGSDNCVTGKLDVTDKADFDAAIAACRALVDRSLRSSWKAGMLADDLCAQYVASATTPSSRRRPARCPAHRCFRLTPMRASGLRRSAPSWPASTHKRPMRWAMSGSSAGGIG